MTVLVIAEHDNASIKGATLNTVTAAIACGAGDVHVLVAGHNAGCRRSRSRQHRRRGQSHPRRQRRPRTRPG
jgi:electron transfer flavoprotein alpha subunit